MTRTKRDSFDIELIASKLREARTVSASGELSFSGFPFGEFTAVLRTAIKFNPEIPRSAGDRLLREAVFAAGKHAKITKEGLLAAIGKAEQSYLRQPLNSYALVSSLSIRASRMKVQRRRTEGCSMVFSRQPPGQFDRESIAEDAEIRGHRVDSRDYTYVTARVKSRSPSEAFDKAIGAIDFMRGLWNFSLNRLTLSRRAWPTRPINSIRLGQVHTLHHLKGKLVGEGYWHESDFHESAWDGKNHWTHLLRDERGIRRLVSTASYGSELMSAFRRYARALDGLDFETRYLRLWSLLEFLTDADGSNERAIRRCLFLYEDRDVERQVLEHLREQRNLSVHGAGGASDFEPLLFQLKRYVEGLLQFHSASANRFKSKAEAGEYLDLPHDPDVLRRQLRKLQSALRFRSRS